MSGLASKFVVSINLIVIEFNSNPVRAVTSKRINEFLFFSTFSKMNLELKSEFGFNEPNKFYGNINYTIKYILLLPVFHNA